MKKFPAKTAGMVLFAALTGMYAVTAQAVDSVSFEVGAGEKVEMARIGFQWDFNKKWFDSNGTHLGGYWDLSIADWHQRRYKNMDKTRDIGVVGITPVFRFQNNNKKGFYVEAGIGAYLFSERYDNRGREFSTAFQFGDHIGIGYVFNNKFELGLKYQHFSNAGIKDPNPGENFVILKGSYQF